MKQLILIIAFVAYCGAICDTFAQKAGSYVKKEPALKTGYLIIVTGNDRFTKIKTESLVEVYSIAETVFPGNCVNFEKELSESLFFDMYSYKKGIYVEKKRVNKNGKYKYMKK